MSRPYFPGLNQPCGCALIFEGVKGAHEPGCPYIAHCRKHGDTIKTWWQSVNPGRDFYTGELLPHEQPNLEETITPNKPNWRPK